MWQAGMLPTSLPTPLVDSAYARSMLVGRGLKFAALKAITSLGQVCQAQQSGSAGAGSRSWKHIRTCPGACCVPPGTPAPRAPAPLMLEAALPCCECTAAAAFAQAPCLACGPAQRKSAPAARPPSNPVAVRLHGESQGDAGCTGACCAAAACLQGCEQPLHMHRGPLIAGLRVP